jgi:hypothetical protein
LAYELAEKIRSRLFELLIPHRVNVIFSFTFSGTNVKNEQIYPLHISLLNITFEGRIIQINIRRIVPGWERGTAEIFDFYEVLIKGDLHV